MYTMPNLFGKMKQSKTSSNGIKISCTKKYKNNQQKNGAFSNKKYLLNGKEI